MLYWNLYKEHKSDIKGKRKKFDNTIYTFDIETSSYLILDNKLIPACNYLELNEKERERCIYQANMYLWQFGINDTVYYGRTWEEFRLFLNKLESNVSELKYVFVHNLTFEFQFLKSVFHFSDVSARKSHKVMTAIMRDYNIMFRCSYFMSNCALKYLPKLFRLPVEKMVGDLDYDLIRHSESYLSDIELRYGEYDCLVVYHYIKEELKTYEDVKHIPTTSTGKVRRELMELIRTDFKYRRLVNKSINTDPHVYNLLVDAFMGGYTHANWIHADEVLKDVDSYDETSAYPYVLVTCKFPSTEFKKINVKSVDDLSTRLAYLLVVKFKNIKCKYFNNFISASKCRNIRGAKYDNGRIISAQEFEMTLTDVDFRFILDTYECSYEIVEAYFSIYNYLPKQFINFVLDKYVNKTKYKDVDGMELEYQKEKNKFNALYGMSVTNNIRDNVIYDDKTGMWSEVELTNDEILEKLLNEKKKSFLNFATGVWVTAYARDNLLRRVVALDEYVCYCDTDSCKLIPGYDKNIFIEYNKSVENKIKYVSDLLKIDINRYKPTDTYGKEHMLGIFEFETNGLNEHTYNRFITQGAKKYAFERDEKDKNTKEIIKNKISITVAGVPKQGASALKKLEDFKDDLVFNYKDTHKNLIMYCDNQMEYVLTDYNGKEYKVKDKSGCCVLPTTYVLSKALEYTNLLTDNSSNRAIYKE